MYILKSFFVVHTSIEKATDLINKRLIKEGVDASHITSIVIEDKNDHTYFIVFYSVDILTCTNCNTELEDFTNSDEIEEQYNYHVCPKCKKIYKR